LDKIFLKKVKKTGFLRIPNSTPCQNGKFSEG
jgi:hypothetical protein